MEIVLVHPEIPHNTGCAARLAAAVGVRLHLVEPLGFSLEDRYLKRAGLDYWPMVDLVVHRSWSAAERVLARGSERPLAKRLRLFSARGGSSLFATDFAADDLLVFGSESKGLPADLLASHAERRIYIPIRPGIRSLNLANVVCLALYTALDRAGVPLPENDGSYAADPRAAQVVWPVDVARLAKDAGAESGALIDAARGHLGDCDRAEADAVMGDPSRGLADRDGAGSDAGLCDSRRPALLDRPRGTGAGRRARALDG